MTPFEQTMLTLVCMGLSFWWGKKEGFDEGIVATTQALMQAEIITQKDLDKLEAFERELDDDE